MKEGGAEERQGELYPLGGLGDNERPEVRPEKRQDRECMERTGRPAGRVAGMVRWRNPPESLRGQQGKGVEGSEVRARRPEADTTGEKGGSGPPGRTVSADGREAS